MADTDSDSGTSTDLGVKFDAQSADRIADVVRKVETQSKRVGGAAPPTPPITTTFWARITGMDPWYIGSLTFPLYSWIRVTPSQTQNTTLVQFDIAQPPITGSANAREANGNSGVPQGAFVQLQFTGYDPSGAPFYTFSYTNNIYDRTIPPHDHRDLITGGGFAFSVYHPGTGLPQQPWAM